MSYTYTARATAFTTLETTRGPVTHVVIATSWRGENPIAYTFSMDAAQAIADAFNALTNMDEKFLKEKA